MIRKEYFTEINYSASNEDERSELLAFGELDKPTTLCVSASGSRPLSLLITDPVKVVAIDFNSAQNFLLELKISAIRNCDYDEFLDFIGVTACSHDQRIKLYESTIKKDLSIAAQNFWDRNYKYLRSGVLYCGRWEQFQRKLAKPLKWLKFPIHELLHAESIEKQRSIVAKKWKGNLWDFLLTISSWRWVWKYWFKEPGIYLVAKNFCIANYMRSRFNFAFENIHLKTSAFFWLIWTGKYQKVLPLHLLPENFNLIKSRIDRIFIVNSSLADYLFQCSERFDAYSLSDFSSYATKKLHDEVWQGIVKTAESNAKILAREFLVRYDIPENLKNRLERNYVLEKKLNDSDDTCIYSFIAITVN